MDCLCPCKNYIRRRDRWGGEEWRKRTAKIRFVRTFCLREIDKQAEKNGTSAAQASLEIAERWRTRGQRPMTDAAGEQVGKQQLGHLKPKIKEGLKAVTKTEWTQLRFCVDSGAGETVMAEEELPEIDTQASWGSRHGQSYEVANGEEIDNEGEKKFIAHMTTTEGRDSGGKSITAQVCKVHRPLMSVKRMCRAGHRVVFDDDGSYVENKQTGERLTIVEEDGDYLLDVWVKTAGEGEATFGGQGK